MFFSSQSAVVASKQQPFAEGSPTDVSLDLNICH